MAGVLVASGSGELLVTGYAEDDNLKNYSSYQQNSDAHSLMGLQWRLHAGVSIWSPDPALIPWLCVEFIQDQGEEGSTVVCMARIKLSVLLPNGHLFAELEDQARMRYRGTRFEMTSTTNPELNNFLGEEGHLLCESFIFKADIDMCAEPTILYSPTFLHAIAIDRDSTAIETAIAGFQRPAKRLVFWKAMADRHSVTCWAVNPLVPSSLEQLCQMETQTEMTGFPWEMAAALSNDYLYSAFVAKHMDNSYHLYVLHFATNQMVDERYENTEHLGDNIVSSGLTHTRRGWIMTGQGFYGFYRNQIRRLAAPLVPVDQAALGANYNSLIASYMNEDKLHVWDLWSAELNSRLYDIALNRCSWFFRNEEKMWAFLGGPNAESSGILCQLEFDNNQWRIKPCCEASDVHRVMFDDEKLIFVNQRQEQGNGTIVVQTVWMPGHIPTAKDMATMEIQKRTGRQEMMQTALGVKSVWRGGMTEQMIKTILRVFYRPEVITKFY